ncbi:MAG TPA: terminase TerL endonuclease subunit [Rhodopila sp.]
MWDLSCPDWERRIRTGASLIPDLPLNREEADLGLQIFDELRLPDVAGMPKLKDAAGQWFRDIVRATFGSWDPRTEERMIRDIFLLAPKGQSKTSYSAGLMLTAMLMNRNPRAEMLFVGPTQAISDGAYDQAVGMIEAAPELKRRFRPIEHQKRIEDLVNKSEMRIKTFDLSILTGSMPSFVLVDELHLLGRNAHTEKVLRQIRGGLEKRRDGLLLITTTQSDQRPVGAFRAELMMARKIRDGAFRGQNIRPMLPVLYEFPEDIAKDQKRWEDPAMWGMVMPNLGRSVRLSSLIQDWEAERAKGAAAIQVWASQHLNIEIGVGLKTDDWRGAEYWPEAAEPGLTFEGILGRCDVVCVGIDGGGLDDLLGLAVLGRERVTRRWLLWTRAWAHTSVLERRKGEEALLRDLEAAGDLVIVDEMEDAFAQLADIVATVDTAGLLAKVGLDPMGVGAIVDALAEKDIAGEARVVGISQGWTLNGAIKTSEIKLASGTLVHCGQPLMAWCVGNAKVEPRGNAITITKQISGAGKIDPVMAALNAVALMSRNPEAQGRSGWETDDIDGLMDRIEAAAAAL